MGLVFSTLGDAILHVSSEVSFVTFWNTSYFPKKSLGRLGRKDENFNAFSD